MHTLTTDNTEPSPLRKNEARFIPSLSSMHKDLLTLFGHRQSSTASPFMPQSLSCLTINATVEVYVPSDS